MKTLREELAEYCCSLIDADIEAAEKEPVVPSKRFEKKMLALVRTGKKNTSARIKRIVIIAAAAFLALALAACAVPKVRKSVAGFFVKIFGDHVEYVDPSVAKDHIEAEYGLVPIPEGFELISERKTESSLELIYSDIDDNIIMFHQYADDSLKTCIDSESGEFLELNLGEKTVTIHYSENYSNASWVADGYYFTIDCTSHIDLAVFEGWIDSVTIR